MPRTKTSIILQQLTGQLPEPEWMTAIGAIMVMVVFPVLIAFYAVAFIPHVK